MSRKFFWIATAIVIAVLASVPAAIVWRDGDRIHAVMVFILSGAVLATPIAILRNQRIDKQRKRDIQKVSVELELGLDRFHLMTLGRFPLLANLKHRKSDEFALAVFDYAYDIPQGKNQSRTVCQTVVWLRRRGTTLPDFVIRPEAGNWLNRDVLDLFKGRGDIDFQSYPEFSRRYLLRGDDEEAIRKLCNEDVLNFFEQTSGLVVEVAANRLLCYRCGVRVAPDDRRSFVNEAMQLLSQLQPRLQRLANPFDKPSNGLDREQK